MSEGGGISSFPGVIGGALRGIFGKPKGKQFPRVEFTAPPPPPASVFRPDVRLAPRIGSLAAVRGVMRAAPSAPGAPPTPLPAPPSPSIPQQIGDYLDAAISGLSRGADIASLIQYLRSLFAKPLRPVYSFPTFNLGGDVMPYTFMPSAGGYGGGGDYGLAGLGSGIASVINAIRGPSAMPGGMSFLPTAGALGTIARGVGGVLGGVGVGMGLESLFGGGACPSSPFASGASTVRAQTFVTAHPETGRAVWFKPAGRPILWSGDLSAARRVRKIAGRARRRVGGR